MKRRSAIKTATDKDSPESPNGLVSPEAAAERIVYQAMVECMEDGYLELSEQGEVLFANASAERLLGRLRTRIIGQRLDDLFPGAEIDLTSHAGNGMAQLQPDQKQCALVVSEHGPRNFEFGIYPYGEGYGLFFNDVNERLVHVAEIAKLKATMAASQELLRHKNEELNKSLEQLEQLNDQLAQADQLKSEFLANTSHELRTPLNSIIGFLQLIIEGLCESPEEERDYVGNALTSAKHLLQLINDVLDIAKIEAGKMNFLIDDFVVDSLFQEVRSLTHVQASQARLEMTFERRGAETLDVRADFNKTKQVLINLVGNSIKFTDKGSVKVWAEPDPDQPDQVRFNVQDTGIGVPPNQQKKIFEKFRQVDGSSTRRFEGTGLGLTITKNLVELMSGSIDLFSEGEGKGTTIFFTLPSGGTNGQGAPDPNEEGVDQIMEERLPTSF